MAASVGTREAWEDAGRRSTPTPQPGGAKLRSRRGARGEPLRDQGRVQGGERQDIDEALSAEELEDNHPEVKALFKAEAGQEMDGITDDLYVTAGSGGLRHQPP